MSYIRGKNYCWRDDKYIYLPVDKQNKLSLKIFDELVVMRYYQLQDDNKLEETEQRSIKNNSFNFGCDSLRKKHGLNTTMEMSKIIEELNKKYSLHLL